ncbi:type IX secretion system membrane protein PorP/SprF [Ohtaekwangia kribbensis]|jgi:type IX secretion system PorP/SprF family membrane protein|uniref:Type IX secretion system membrane protein PorP/SprF n=1 Tax=Ohtaekwangia kribbensis TaxID=688913 RepID=A0ABW3K012_9BACT
MKKYIVFIFLCAGFVATGQDPHFSQYYQAPLYLNPGFTGITPQQRLVVNHRIQWPSLPQAFSTYAASYDIFVNELRSGFGILFTTDKMGSAGWRTTTASLLYSYKIKLTSKLVFSPGISFGYGMNGIDRTKLRMGDGLEYNGTSLDPELSRIGNENYLDFGSGFVLYSKEIWLGASFAHINQPDLSVLGESSRLPMKTSIHGGVKIPLQGSRTARPSYLTPSFIYQMQGASFSQLDLGLNYHIDPVSLGLWYRGKPFQKGVNNTVEQDAFIIFLGLYFKNFNIGYSYDFTISKLQSASGGAHEVSLVYEFAARNSDKKKKKYKLIPCPSFNSKEGFWN